DAVALWFSRGDENVHWKDYDGAIADYGEAIRLDPGSLISWNNRGLAKYHSGDFAAGIADFESILRLRPDMAGVWQNLGVARYSAGQYCQAVKDLERAIGLKSGIDTTEHQEILTIARERCKQEQSGGG
ncbi:MAG: tetratricopeptide repeat protein, partial [Planctomycetia bacterium]|nr:tetratricopeptide repeat protein [Planctomycetia bacterium]